MGAAATKISSVAALRTFRQNRILPHTLLRLLHPWTGHVVRNRVEHGFDLADFAVLDLEQLEDQERVGAIKRRADCANGAVDQSILAYRAVVIEKCRRKNHLALLVHQVTAIAAAGDHLEHSSLKLRLASHPLHCSGLRVRVIGRNGSVFHTLAVGIEGREELARILLDGREITVRESDQLVPRDALARGFVLGEKRLVFEVLGPASKRSRALRSGAVLSGDNYFNFRDFMLNDLETGGENGQMSILIRNTQKTDLAGLRVVDINLVCPPAVGGLPQTFPELHLDVVLGVPDVRCVRQLGWVVCGDGAHILIDEAIEASAVAVPGFCGGRSAGGTRAVRRAGGKHKQQYSQSGPREEIPAHHSPHTGN